MRYVRFVLFALTAVLALGAQSEKGEKKAKAPAAVLEAFKRQYPKAQIKAVTTEKEKGKVVYEVESVDGTVHRDLLYTPDGRVIEIEEAISNAEIPKAVSDAIAVKYPKAPIVSGERLTRDGTLLYEVVIKVAGKNKEIQVDPSGRIQ